MRNILLALVLLVAPAVAQAGPAMSAACTGAGDGPVCGTGRGHGWYMDKDDYEMYYLVNGTDWLKLSGSGATLTISSLQATSLVFSDALTLSSTLGLAGDLTLSGGAGALTFDAASSSVVVPNNSATALDIGSSGLTNHIRMVTTTNAEYTLFSGGVGNAAVSITDTTTLDASDCGKPLFVTAGIDTKSITLPALSAVPGGCVYRFFYVGADAGALVDISPNSADGVEGTCTLAASIVTFSGTDDADIGLTKATGIQGDSITLVSGNADDWYVAACSGIWANN